LRGRFIYAPNRKGFVSLVNILKRYNFPATFNITGHLYLKSCNGWPHFHELKPRAKWFFKKDWYYWDPKSDFISYPGIYFGDFLEKIKENPLFDFGIHGFAHECWPLEKKEIVESGIDAALKSARKIKINPISFSAPFNITEDKQNPAGLYNSLKKSGIKIIRFAGEDEYPRRYDHQFKTIPPFKKNGLIAVHVSMTFDGTSSLDQIHNIIKDIKEKSMYSGREVIYCLCCHDFTFKNLKKIEMILKEVLILEDKGKIKLINTRDLIEEL